MDTTHEVTVTFLTQGGQHPEDIAHRLADFISGATQTLEIAIYDFRLTGAASDIVVNALHDRAQHGVNIRIVYDEDKPEMPTIAQGADPAPSGSGQFIRALGLPAKPIGGPKLMHHKYVIRDSATPQAAVWTGSTNFTNDSWTLQENNIVTLPSSTIAQDYLRDFTDIWEAGAFGASGEFVTHQDTLTFQGGMTQTQAWFAPGRGMAIDELVASIVRSARQRIRICSMLLNSGTLLNALLQHLDRGDVAIDGIYDAVQMETVLEQWQSVPHNVWKIDAVKRIAQEAQLVGKHSHRYSPTSPHDFMHNKVLLVDDQVITGSYNFSRSAEVNAENLIVLRGIPIVQAYSSYIDRMQEKYRSQGA